MTFKDTQAMSDAYKLATPPSLTFVLNFEADAPNTQLVSIASRLDIKMDSVFIGIGSWWNAQEEQRQLPLTHFEHTTITVGQNRGTSPDNSNDYIQHLRITEYKRRRL
jgi:hypothetical protein